MTIQRRDSIKFLYQDASDNYHELEFDADGVGVALTHGATLKSHGRRHLTKTAISVDSDELAAWLTWHVSRKAVAAVYETDQTLEEILNPA